MNIDTAEEFDDIMILARSIRAEDPAALLDLVKLLGREMQSRHMVLPASYPEGGVPPNETFKDSNVWFPLNQYLTRDQRKFWDIAEPVCCDLTLELGRDLVIPDSWNQLRLKYALLDVGTDRPDGPWIQDPNHKVDLLLPINVGLVWGGHHSITAGILRAEGRIHVRQAHDMTPVYQHLECDGAHYRRVHDGAAIAPVRNVKLAAIYEIGRLLLDKEN